MQAVGAWLPLLLLGLLLLLPASKGQSLPQNCTQDLRNMTCSCLLPHERQYCSDPKLSVGAIVGITLGLVLLLAGVIVGTVLGIRRKRQRWDASEPCLRKPTENGSAPGWQPRYGSRSSRHFTAAPPPSPPAAPSPSSPGALLYENLFLGSQPSHQSPNPSQSREASPDPEGLYMNYEDCSRSEHPIYGNVENLTYIPDPQASPHPGAEDEDDYVVPGC
ncbi:leucine-rich repeat-containing protein 25 [Trichosurus vulpecula]|uniref:leucine-rich repeat-containing protein 25 n=1 Tax=Trichosurus vulpecula TaxID=9337 RepID=UPI00186B46CA|nr:leucine-rich repeat-containing protein 25 [Trichosurus vulpecula]